MDATTSEPKPIRKRQRKTLVCAECRRLKLKCDRSNGWPCVSCVKRGVQSICPDNTATSVGITGVMRQSGANRVILASSREVHKQNEVLSERVRQLEAALAQLQAATSEEPHPLLSEEFLRLTDVPGSTPEPLADTQQNEVEAPDDGQELTAVKEEEDLVDAFGTLHLTADGSYFYGGSAACEFLVTDTQGSLADRAKEGVPTNLLLLASQFPFYSLNTAIDDLKNQLRSNLPSLQDAWRIVTIYFDNAAWIYRPLSKDVFLEDVVTPIYKDGGTVPLSGSQLALLYIILGIGTLADTQVPKYTILAEHYHQLARASLALENTLVNPSLTALVAVFGLCVYATLSDRRDAIQECSVLQGVLVKMAQGIGLHRDPAKFNLAQREMHKRRRLFWEIYFLDMWLSFAVGRPAGISLIDVDTEIPVYPEDEGDSRGFHTTKIEFALRFLQPTLEKLFSSGKRKYSTILDLDKEINDKYTYSEHFKIAGLDPDAAGDHDPVSLSTTMQKHTLHMIKDILLLYIHRGCFAQALQQSRSDPLASNFAPSVTAAYRSACAILTYIRHSFDVEPEATLRVPFFWSHAGTSSVILAATAIMAAKTPFASSALAELDRACTLFEAASSNMRVARYMPTILGLRDKARSVLLQSNTGRLLEPNVHLESLQELSGLSGATRISCEVNPTEWSLRPHDPQACRQMDINRLEAPQYGRLDISTEQADTGASLSSGAAGGMQTGGYSVEFDHPALVGQFLQDIGPMPAGNSTGDSFALQGSSVDQALGASNAEDASNPWVPHVANVLDGPEVDWDSLMNELGFVE